MYYSGRLRNIYRNILISVCVWVSLFVIIDTYFAQTNIDDNQAVIDTEMCMKQESNGVVHWDSSAILPFILEGAGFVAIIAIYNFLMEKKSIFTSCWVSLYFRKPQNIHISSVFNQCKIYHQGDCVEQSSFPNSYYIVVRLGISVPRKLLESNYIVVKQLVFNIDGYKYVYTPEEKCICDIESGYCIFLLKYPEIKDKIKNSPNVVDAFIMPEERVSMDISWKNKGWIRKFGLWNYRSFFFQNQEHTPGKMTIDIAAQINN